MKKDPCYTSALDIGDITHQLDKILGYSKRDSIGEYIWLLRPSDFVRLVNPHQCHHQIYQWHQLRIGFHQQAPLNWF